ncbi:glycosyltransferase family 4 protein [Solidesulfovibrio aerotolerans]|uniref:glycosyltransferase family 4 protein n=1 Tax=Solidesulfovibrio aerotolerans TaxID=295255 RepID=UPI0013687B36|nr:glycosyltransferase family 4 protein [Solidesulfovibrio aerotolerans]
MVLAHPWGQVSTPPLMTAQFLVENGYDVDMFVAFDQELHDMGICLPEFHRPGVRVFASVSGQASPPARLADGTVLPPEHWAAVAAARRLPAAYDWIIGFDPGGLARAAALSGIWGAPYIYHSLEIDDRPSPAKDLERHCNKGALFTLTQDRQRADVLAKLNRLDRKSVHISINSSLGPVLPQKDSYFRDRFPIGDRRLVLALGTLHPSTCTDAILASLAAWPKNFALVMHGWLPDKSFRTAVEAFVAERDNVWLSLKIVPPEQKFQIFQSADVGLVFFSPDDHNLKYAAGSAGKLYDFMRCGVPMIGNDIPGMAALLNDSGCGFVVPDAASLPAALPLVASRYDGFRENCLRTFPRYEFAMSYGPLLRLMQR